VASKQGLIRPVGTRKTACQEGKDKAKPIIHTPQLWTYQKPQRSKDDELAKAAQKR